MDVAALADALAAIPHRAHIVDVDLKGLHDRAVVEVLAAGRGPGLVRGVVSSFDTGDPGTGGRSRPGVAALARHQEPIGGYDQAGGRLECQAISVEYHAIERGRSLPCGMPTSTLPRGPCAVARPRPPRSVSASSPLASRPRHSTADRGRRRTGDDGSGGPRGRRGRDGGRLGVGLRRDRWRGPGHRPGAWSAGMGASSRAAGIVRAQGGTPATVGLGRWSIDFYRGQHAVYGTDSGFRELGYLILAVTEDDERAGRERVAMQQAAGLATCAGCRRRRPSNWPARCRRPATAAAAIGTVTATSIRRATSRRTRSRCGGRASSCVSDRR